MKSMGFNSEMQVEERDFFARELDRLDRIGVMAEREGPGGDPEAEDLGWDGPPLIEGWQ